YVVPPLRPAFALSAASSTFACTITQSFARWLSRTMCAMYQDASRPTTPNGTAKTRPKSVPASLLTMAASVPQRLAGLQHVLDALLRLRHRAQLDEVAPLQVEQPLLVDHAARLHRAAAQDLGNAPGDLV